MAPRRPTVAQQEDRCSILKLIVEKGPLSGQTITFKPENSLRIGRLVRGNDLSIKDPGISSKHLVIQLEMSSDSGCRHWTVTDLGSSNGTVLNDAQVQPSEPYVLSDGDVVKIGETTVIKVKFENNGSECEGDGGNGRKNVRRGRKNQGVELEVIDEGSVLGLEGNVSGSRYNLRGKRAKGKAGILGSDSLKLRDDCGAKIGGRRTRGSKAKVLVNRDDEIEEEMENSGELSSKNNKSSSKKEDLEDLGTDTYEFDCKVVELEGKGGKITNMRTRSLKKTDNVLDDLKGIESVGMRVSTRRTRSSRMEESLGEIGVDSVVNDGKMTQKGTRGKCNATVKATSLEVETEEEPKFEHEICEENKGGLEAQVDELIEESLKSGAGFTSMSGVKECDVGSEKTVVDLEKLTLGEWFDFLEVHLPKQIIDDTEEMISAMEQNVQKLNKFMLEKKNNKERDELLVD